MGVAWDTVIVLPAQPNDGAPPALIEKAVWTDGLSIPSEKVTTTSAFTGTPVCPGGGVRAVTVGNVSSIVKSLPEESQDRSAVVSRAHTRTRAVVVSMLGIGFQLYEFRSEEHTSELQS